jgi:hypothetical protein
VHEQREGVGRDRSLDARRSPLDRLLGRRNDDLDLTSLELGAELGKLLVVEIMLVGERLEGVLLDRSVVLGILEKLGDYKFKRGAQFSSSLPSSSGFRRL